MSQKELGQNAEAKATIKKIQDYVDKQKEVTTTVVDIYSKFGEDGSSDTIKARNLYLQGLINLAEGDKASANRLFTESLGIDPSNIWAKYFKNATR